MRYVRDLGGIQTPQITDEPIATGTNIVKGAYVSQSAGLVIAAVNSLATKVLGVLASGHNGVNGVLSPWNAALTTRVYSSPTAVFAYTAPVLTATTNSTTNTLEATGMADLAAANALQGGYLEYKTAVTSATITDAVGTRKLITASANATCQMTAAFTGAVLTGDTFYCYPPKGFYKGEFSSDASAMVLTATTNGPLEVVGWDFDKKEVHVAARLHQYGSQDA